MRLVSAFADGLYPPALTTLVGDDDAVCILLSTEESPKSIAFPSVASVIKSITLLWPSESDIPEKFIPRTEFDAIVFPSPPMVVKSPKSALLPNV